MGLNPDIPGPSIIYMSNIQHKFTKTLLNIESADFLEGLIVLLFTSQRLSTFLIVLIICSCKLFAHANFRMWSLLLHTLYQETPQFHCLLFCCWKKNVNEDKAMTLEDTVRKIILTLTERPFLHEEIKGVPALIAFH